MDDQRFDAITRAFAGNISRRGAIKGMLASLAGGALLTTRFDHTSAQCGSTGEYCDSTTPCCDGLHCCHGQSTNICAECCGNDQCPQGSVCEGFICVPVDQCEVAGEYCDSENPCCVGLQCCYGQSTNICAECCGDDQCPVGDICQNWTCVPESGCGAISRYCDSENPCCDGLHCCYGQATNICAECCGNDQCPQGAMCEGFTCVPVNSGPVATLPATGAGDQNQSDGLFGAAALGTAAAALVAAKKLREYDPEPDTGR